MAFEAVDVAIGILLFGGDILFRPLATVVIARRLACLCTRASAASISIRPSSLTESSIAAQALDSVVPKVLTPPSPIVDWSTLR